MGRFDWAVPTDALISEEIDEARMRIAVLRVRLAEVEPSALANEDDSEAADLTVRLSALQDHLATAVDELHRLEAFRDRY